MSLGVHALNIGIVVVLLAAISGAFRSTRTGHAAHQQSHSGARARAFVPAYRGTGDGPHCGADGGTAQSGIGGGLIGRGSANLVGRVLLAIAIVHTELVKVLPGTGQRHDARAGGHGCACT